VTLGEGICWWLTEFVFRFSDTGGHWAEDDIYLMAARRIAQGYPDGSFCPDGSVLRSEVLAFIDRVLAYIGFAGDSAGGDTGDTWGFSDVSPDDWFAAYLDDVVNTGLMVGFPDGTFRPGDPVTREQVSLIITRLLELMGAELPDVSDHDVLGSYSDYDKVGEWARVSMAQAVLTGLIKGYNNQLRPKDPITRAELITIIRRVLDYVYMLRVQQ